MVYGGGGAIGGAVARALARDGARVFLAGRTPAKLDRVAREITAAGGQAESAVVDALDEAAVEAHADAVAARAGGIDIALNAVGIVHVQGPPFAELSFQDYAHPIAAYTRTNFITAKAVARHMVKRGSGVILTLSTPGSRMAGQGFLGYGVPCGAIEMFSRSIEPVFRPVRGRLYPAAFRDEYGRELALVFVDRHGRAGVVLWRQPVRAPTPFVTRRAFSRSVRDAPASRSAGARGSAAALRPGCVFRSSRRPVGVTAVTAPVLHLDARAH